MKLGKNMTHALNFAQQNPGWHTFNKKCKSTVKAIQSLEKRNLVETNEFGQYRLFVNSNRKKEEYPIGYMQGRGAA